MIHVTGSTPSVSKKSPVHIGKRIPIAYRQSIRTQQESGKESIKKGTFGDSPFTFYEVFQGTPKIAF